MISTESLTILSLLCLRSSANDTHEANADVSDKQSVFKYIKRNLSLTFFHELKNSIITIMQATLSNRLQTQPCRIE